MTPRRIALLGSTGSIGRATLDVIRAHPGHFIIRALAARSNVDLLVEQCNAFKPDYVCLVDQSRAEELKERLKSEPVKTLVGEKEMVRLAALDDVDIVVNAIVGAAGLLASLEAIKGGKSLALANKESLVSGGPLFPPLIRKTKAKILPIDSEHSAIWQALACGREDEVKNVVITASGGPFREYPREKLDAITKEQALNHPTWKMGPKITVDSATLANKGLEVIEAGVLFSISPEKIKVVIHPQSIVHSMVEFVDSSVMAQLSNPDMKLPITYALFWPQRVRSDFGALAWDQLPHLTFETPDMERFRALRIAYEVAGRGGTAPAVFNAANEIAVDAFLNSTIKFTQITDIIENAVQELDVVSDPTLDDILHADNSAREFAERAVGKLACL